jgi:hypothetical protein
MITAALLCAFIPIPVVWLVQEWRKPPPISSTERVWWSVVGLHIEEASRHLRKD